MKFCLNMIVKNESKIIKRLLQSVYDIFENDMTFCICDTGSEDDTCNLIYSFSREKKISGHIINEPFKNFEWNRNFVLSYIQKLEIKCDYVLLLDADMMLTGNKVNIVNYITNINKIDGFQIFQGTEDFFYPNIRIIKNLPMNGLSNSEKGFHYIGVTHEVINTPKDYKINVIDRSILFINDVGDGGAKSDKYTRDIKLLQEYLFYKPNDSRNTFYLANSYHDSGQFEKAIDVYKKRIILGGWVEELYYSAYRIGLCYMELSKSNSLGFCQSEYVENAIYYFLKAYEIHPHRVENLYQIIKHYRQINSGRLALHFCKLACDIAKETMTKGTPQFLFHHNKIYEYGLDVEYIVLSKLDGNMNVSKELLNVLNRSNDVSMCYEALFYYNMYVQQIKSNAIKHFTFNSNIGEFVSSSSSIIQDTMTSNYIYNVRYVNYLINPDGTYKCGPQIETINVQYILNSTNMNVLSKHIYNNGVNDMRKYRGIEDLRIFNHNNGNIYFTGTGLHNSGKIGVVFGVYNNNANLISYELNSPRNNDCEKNWVFVQNTDNSEKIRMIYHWHPLQIGVVQLIKNDISSAQFSITETYPTPRLFRFVRGSTNLIKFDNHNLFAIAHMVSPSTSISPRIYYHLFIKISNDFKTIKYTMPFKFTSESIEYCIGLTINNKNESEIICTYSTWDRTTNLCIFNKSFINSLFID